MDPFLEALAQEAITTLRELARPAIAEAIEAEMAKERQRALERITIWAAPGPDQIYVVVRNPSAGGVLGILRPTDDQGVITQTGTRYDNLEDAVAALIQEQPA